MMKGIHTHGFTHFTGKRKGLGKATPRGSTRRERRLVRGTHENKYRKDG